ARGERLLHPSLKTRAVLDREPLFKSQSDFLLPHPQCFPVRKCFCGPSTPGPRVFRNAIRPLIASPSNGLVICNGQFVCLSKPNKSSSLHSSGKTYSPEVLA